MKKQLKYFALLGVLILLLCINLISCKDDLNNIIKEDPYDVKIAWTGYYNFAKEKSFNGAFNEVDFKFDATLDGELYAVTAENTNLSQLSLERVVIRLKNAAVGNYPLGTLATGKLLHYKDYSKPTLFTELVSGKVEITKFVPGEEIEGSFDGWGISGADTMFLQGNFYRKKKS